MPRCLPSPPSALRSTPQSAGVLQCACVCSAQSSTPMCCRMVCVQGVHGCRWLLGCVPWLIKSCGSSSGIPASLARHVRAGILRPSEGIQPLKVRLPWPPPQLCGCAAPREQSASLCTAATHQGSAHLPRARARPNSRHPPLTADPLGEHPQHPLLCTSQLIPPILRKLLCHQACEVMHPLRGLAVGAEAEPDGLRAGTELCLHRSGAMLRCCSGVHTQVVIIIFPGIKCYKLTRPKNPLTLATDNG